MKNKILNYLRCPKCKRCLKIDAIEIANESEIIQGILTCNCGKEFLIESGVPNMLYETSKDVEKTVLSYYRKWNDFDYGSDFTYGLSPKQRISDFFKAFNITPSDLNNKNVFDAGCGNGQLACNIAKFGCEVIAMDISSSVKKAFKNCEMETIYFVQGDVLHMPFGENSFDYVWCHGVLMNVSNPKEAFNVLSKLVKKDGKLYAMFYSSEPRDVYSRIRWPVWRFVSGLPSSVQKFLSFPFTLFILSIKSLRRSSISSRLVHESRSQYYEMFTTPHTHKHRKEEIIQWFKDNNFKNLQIENFSSGFSFSICGTKT